ncbi:hypothetical protein EJD97_009632 [Solanum chilense]|uniref:Uncharacterized protein n=1 Tax=Solanum chilense TaxID=4083 RepID=A0A6N2AI87_SOLCI|nr:hypothetical protein EJD97_009632 [Solanum chilense]
MLQSSLLCHVAQSQGARMISRAGEDKTATGIAGKICAKLYFQQGDASFVFGASFTPWCEARTSRF